MDHYYPIVGSHHLNKLSLNLNRLSPLDTRVKSNNNCCSNRFNRLIYNTSNNTYNNSNITNKGSSPDIKCIMNKQQDKGDIKPIAIAKKTTFKPLSRNMDLKDNDSLRKENKMLKLQIRQLTKENYELREQNEYYSHQLLSKAKCGILDLPLLEKAPNGIKLNVALNKNEETAKISEALLINPTISSTPRSYNLSNHHHNLRKISQLKKKAESIHSIDILPLFSQRTNGSNPSLFKDNINYNDKDKDKDPSPPYSTASNLSKLKERIIDTLTLYSIKLSRKSNKTLI